MLRDTVSAHFLIVRTSWQASDMEKTCMLFVQSLKNGIIGTLQHVDYLIALPTIG